MNELNSFLLAYGNKLDSKQSSILGIVMIIGAISFVGILVYLCYAVFKRSSKEKSSKMIKSSPKENDSDFDETQNNDNKSKSSNTDPFFLIEIETIRNTGSRGNAANHESEKYNHANSNHSDITNDEIDIRVQQLKDELNGLDDSVYHKQLSDELHHYHETLYENFDFHGITIKPNKHKPLSAIECNFLKCLSGQEVDNLYFPIYWTLEYKVNYYKLITKLIENGYVEIAYPKDDVSFLSGEQLKAALKSINLKVSGKKQEQIDRLLSSSNVVDALKSIGQYKERFLLTAAGKAEIGTQSVSVSKKVEPQKRYYMMDGSYKNVDVSPYINNFEEPRQLAYKQDDLDKKIELLETAVSEYKKSKEWFSKTAAGREYFKYGFDCLNVPGEPKRSYIDDVKEAIKLFKEYRDNVIPKILELASAPEGILQKDMYSHFDVSKSDVQKMVRYLESQGKIKRVKKSGSYLITKNEVQNEI